MDAQDASLVRIPDLNTGECAVVETLLQASGTFYISLPGDNEFTGTRLLIRGTDFTDVKELLADFKIQTPTGKLVPIPW
jgi:hypothetical protein